MESVLESPLEQDEWYRAHTRTPRILKQLDFKICSEMLFILSAPKLVTLRRQSWDFPYSLDVWPDFFRCVEFLLVECTNAIIKTVLGREFRNGLVDSIRSWARL